jgi:hypothetical protein
MPEPPVVEEPRARLPCRSREGADLAARIVFRGERYGYNWAHDKHEPIVEFYLGAEKAPLSRWDLCVIDGTSPRSLSYRWLAIGRESYPAYEYPSDHTLSVAELRRVVEWASSFRETLLARLATLGRFEAGAP